MPVKGAKHILALKRRKVRETERKYIIEGIRLCEEALASGAEVEQMVFCRESIDRNDRLAALFERTTNRRIPIQQTDWRAFKGMADTETPQGVLGVVAMPDWDRPKTLSSGHPLLVLDRVADPGNLGVIMRTAEAAGSAGIFLTTGSVELYNPKVVRASMGAIFRLPVFAQEPGVPLLQTLKDNAVSILAAHVQGIPFHSLAPTGAVALLLGNEAFGIDPDLLALSDQTITIPMAAPVESLNIAVAAGILLYKFCLPSVP